MRILFLQQQPCVRALKYAVALRSAFPQIRLGFAYQGKRLSEWYGSGDELFERWWNLGSEPIKGLRAAGEAFRPDLIHSHNLPDSLTALALEQFAIEQCSALVAVSPELLEEIRTRYRVTAPTLAFANYALGRDLPSTLPSAARRNGHPPRLVYQGTLSTNGGHYDLEAIFRALVGEGLSLDVYPSRSVPAYAELAAGLPGLRMHATLPPPQLFAALPEYDFGWAGFNSALNGAHLNTCLPNKVYDYLGCGLPVLTLGHRALSQLVGENGLGLSLATFEDLVGQLSAVDMVELRRRVAAMRLELTVEANIHRLAELYEAVAG